MFRAVFSQAGDKVVHLPFAHGVSFGEDRNDVRNLFAPSFHGAVVIV